VPIGQGPDGVLKTAARSHAEHMVNLGRAPYLWGTAPMSSVDLTALRRYDRLGGLLHEYEIAA
jgi:hypothetical protein